MDTRTKKHDVFYNIDWRAARPRNLHSFHIRIFMKQGEKKHQQKKEQKII